MTTLDFRKQKKNFLKITLSDEAETKLSIMQPTKQLFEKMVTMSLAVDTKGATDADALDDVYDVCAQLMSRNREGVRIEKQALEETLDFEDIVLFLQTYGAFVSEIVQGKN